MKKIIVVLLLGLVSSTAFATPITYQFTAKIDLLSSPVDNLDFSIGDTVTGTLTYETGVGSVGTLELSRQFWEDRGCNAVPAGQPNPTDNCFFHDGMADGPSDTTFFQEQPGDTFDLFTISFNLGDTVWEFGGGNDFSIIRHQTNEWRATPDRPVGAFDSLVADASISELDDTGRIVGGIRLFGNGVYTDQFSSPTTLSELPILDDLFRARIFGGFDFTGDGQQDTTVFAGVTSLTRVPAPGTLALLAIVLLGMMSRRRLIRIRDSVRHPSR
ncbi:MAG: PEP-CTERM sorting domain-containing protein [Pseudomonadota bacterium]